LVENFVNVAPHLIGLARTIAVSRQGLIHGWYNFVHPRLSLHAITSFLLPDRTVAFLVLLTGTARTRIIPTDALLGSIRHMRPIEEIPDHSGIEMYCVE
jgi:hypothetical protein